MKQNSTFTSFLVFLIAIILLTITSMLMSSCSGIRYSYFNKQRVPYTASEETKRVTSIPAKPFLNQTENEMKEKVSSLPGNNTKQKTTVQSEPKKKSSPATLEQIFTEKNIAKYVPKQYKGIQSENNTNTERETMIVLLVVLILVILALLGDGLIWLLFLALLVLLVYALIKYLGVFN